MIKCIKKCLSYLSAVSLCIGATGVGAQESSQSAVAESGILLQELQIESNAASVDFAPTGADGEWVLSREYLQNYAHGDSSVTQVLEGLPNVHFDNSRRDSDSVFNIAPASVSISGGRSYENNFSLDGFSMNSRFDPGHNGSVSGDLPGHDQGMFVDLDLIESVTVYSSNVPARYGKFLGGAVDMQTRSYSAKPQTSIAWRYMNDSMVETRVYQLKNATTLTEAPEFSRSHFSIQHSRPLDEQSGITLAFTRSASSRPFIAAGIEEDATQENYNFFTKYQRAFDSGLNADFTLMYMPYTTRNYLPTYRHSTYDVEGGGLQAGTKLQWINNRNENVTFDIGYGWKTSSRSAPDHTYIWRATESKPWGTELGSKTSMEGGVGDIERHDHTASVRFITSGIINSDLFSRINYEYGVDTSISFVGYERPQDSFSYLVAKEDSSVRCNGNTFDCIEGEQYFTSRNVYAAESVWVSLLESGAFAELTLGASRLTSTFGVRADYNNFTDNIDVAPRTRFSYDVFDNNNTVLVAGLNRYYGATLLTYKLREARKPYYQETRRIDGNKEVEDWIVSGKHDSYVYQSNNDLKTPYSDEISLGVRQAFLGGILSLDLLHRNNRDQFGFEETDVQSNGYKIRTVNNDGFGQYNSVSLAWARQWSWRIQSNVMVTWSKSETTNEEYDEESTDDGFEYVWYNDARWSKEDLNVLRANFSRPIIATLQLSKNFSDYLKTSLTVRYESDYDYVYSVGTTKKVSTNNPENPSETEVLPNYRDGYRPEIIMADLSLELTPSLQYPLTFTADINNIGNARTYLVAEGTRGVEVGRSFWLGLKYDF